MNIYDFDNTIYDGDSSIDFFIYSLKKHKKNLARLPIILSHATLYILRIEKKDKFKSHFFSFLKQTNDLEKDVEEFWNSHEKKIKSFYIQNKQKDDIIISASPYFLLKPICGRLGINNLMATNIDIKTGKLIGKNCYGDEKRKRLAELNINECDKFYTDSLSDMPLIEIAKQAFIVKGNKIKTWR